MRGLRLNRLSGFTPPLAFIVAISDSTMMAIPDEKKRGRYLTGQFCVRMVLSVWRCVFWHPIASAHILHSVGANIGTITIDLFISHDCAKRPLQFDTSGL